MKKLASWILPFLAAFLLAGCLETTTLVRVDKNGGGTIEERVVISDSFMQILNSMSENAQTETQEAQTLDEEELEARAARMGEGVSLQSTEKLTTEKGKGFMAVFQFQDINKVRINQNPGENVPTTAQALGGQEVEQEYIQFRFTKGSPNTLVILAPKLQPKEKTEAEGEKKASEQEEDSTVMMDMLRQIYQDMRIGMAVEVQGTIVDSNAAYREGSRITLMEVNFGTLLQDEETFKRLVTADPQSLEETKALIKNSPGMKVDLQEEIRVRFK